MITVWLSSLLLPFSGYYVSNAAGGTAPNVIAPQMQAIISSNSFYSTLTKGQNTPPRAEVYIRSAGTPDLIPAAATALPIKGLSLIDTFGVTGGITYAALLSPGTGLISFTVPAGTPQGSAEILFRTGTDPFQSVNVTVAANNFALSPGVSVLNSDGTLTAVGLASPARPGQAIVVTGSGLGYGTSVTAAVGGQPATVVYSGHGPATGYDTIQVRLPASVPDGCYVPLNLTVGANTVMSLVSVTASGTPCQHPYRLSTADLKKLDSGGTIGVIHVDFNTTLRPALDSAVYRSETARVWAETADALTLSRSMQNTLPIPTATFIIGAFTAVATALPEPPDLGEGLTLSHAGVDYNANNYVSLPARDGTLINPPASLVGPGSWTLSLPGSKDVAAATVTFTLPSPLMLNGPALVSLRRNQDQTITWNGNTFDPASALTFVPIAGLPSNVSTAAAGAGTITIPAAAWNQLPPNTLATLSANVTRIIPAANLTAKNGATLAVVVSYTTADERAFELP
jgi:uncharacterized protein (TIGR03437 family)